jgi:hypothetical protein
MAMWRKPGAYRGSGEVAAWLWGILHDGTPDSHPAPAAMRAPALSTMATVCAAAMTFGDRTTGGIAGATFTTVVYATTFLPPQSWLPLPSHPDAPGAIPRLLMVLVCATATFACASRDPATQRLRLGTHTDARSATLPT